MDRLLYSRAEAAARLSLSIRAVDNLISRNLLASRRIGAKRLIPHAALVAFAQKNHPSPNLPKKKTALEAS